jgi:hypothetical protein
VFALRDAGPPCQDGFGWGSDGTHEVTVRQEGRGGEFTVQTGSRVHALHGDWMLLSRWLHEAVHPEPAFPLELHADRWQDPVRFDGAAYPFTFIGNGERWVAGGTVAGRGVTLSGSGATDALELEAVKRRAVREVQP